MKVFLFSWLIFINCCISQSTDSTTNPQPKFKQYVVQHQAIMYRVQWAACSGATYRFSCNRMNYNIVVGRGLRWGIMNSTSTNTNVCPNSPNDCRVHEINNTFLTELVNNCEGRLECTFKVPYVQISECNNQYSGYAYLLLSCLIVPAESRERNPVTSGLVTRETRHPEFTTPLSTTNQSNTTPEPGEEPSVWGTTKNPGFTRISPGDLWNNITMRTPTRNPDKNVVMQQTQAAYCTGGRYEFRCELERNVMWVGYGVNWGVKPADSLQDTCFPRSQDCMVNERDSEFLKHVQEMCNYRHSCWFDVPFYNITSCDNQMADWVILLFKCGVTSNWTPSPMRSMPTEATTTHHTEHTSPSPNTPPTPNGQNSLATSQQPSKSTPQTPPPKQQINSTSQQTSRTVTTSVATNSTTKQSQTGGNLTDVGTTLSSNGTLKNLTTSTSLTLTTLLFPTLSPTAATGTKTTTTTTTTTKRLLATTLSPITTLKTTTSTPTTAPTTTAMPATLTTTPTTTAMSTMASTLTTPTATTAPPTPTTTITAAPATQPTTKAMPASTSTMAPAPKTTKTTQAPIITTPTTNKPTASPTTPMTTMPTVTTLGSTSTTPNTKTTTTTTTTPTTITTAEPTTITPTTTTGSTIPLTTKTTPTTTTPTTPITTTTGTTTTTTTTRNTGTTTTPTRPSSSAPTTTAITTAPTTITTPTTTTATTTTTTTATTTKPTTRPTEPSGSLTTINSSDCCQQNQTSTPQNTPGSGGETELSINTHEALPYWVWIIISLLIVCFIALSCAVAYICHLKCRICLPVAERERRAKYNRTKAEREAGGSSGNIQRFENLSESPTGSSQQLT